MIRPLKDSEICELVPGKTCLINLGTSMQHSSGNNQAMLNDNMLNASLEE